MTKSSIRTIIIFLTLFTATVHLVVLNLEILEEKDSIDVLFTLNGLGYLGLLGAFLFNIPAGRQTLVHYAFMAFVLVTLIAWVAIGARTGLGYTTKTVEVLLIVFLWRHLQRS